jgi:hypothetical protein
VPVAWEPRGQDENSIQACTLILWIHYLAFPTFSVHLKVRFMLLFLYIEYF